MKLSCAGRALLKRLEGCRLEAYQDAVGVWTIGYGHTVDVEAGQKISQHQADVILDSDLERFEEGVEALAPCQPQHCFDGLVCFAFNVGLAALAGSSLLRKLKAGGPLAAAPEFAKWVKGGRPLRVLPGLVKRRKAERALFLGENDHALTSPG